MTEDHDYRECYVCSKNVCFDCAYAGDHYFDNCENCYKSSCSDCALGDLCYIQCDKCYKTMCKECAYSDGHFYDQCDKCDKTTCSECAYGPDSEEAPTRLCKRFECDGELCWECLEKGETCCDSMDMWTDSEESDSGASRESEPES